jgi:hypothetical protein
MQILSSVAKYMTCDAADFKRRNRHGLVLLANQLGFAQTWCKQVPLQFDLAKSLKTPTPTTLAIG